MAPIDIGNINKPAMETYSEMLGVRRINAYINNDISVAPMTPAKAAFQSLRWDADGAEGGRSTEFIKKQ
jgi:hypothetical protein